MPIRNKENKTGPRLVSLDARVIKAVSPAQPYSDRAIRAATRVKKKELQDLTFKLTPPTLIPSDVLPRYKRLLRRNVLKTATQSLAPPTSAVLKPRLSPYLALIEPDNHLMNFINLSNAVVNDSNIILEYYQLIKGPNALM